VISPVFENARSDGTDIAVIHKYFSCILYKSGNVFLYCFQNFNEFFLQS
jgi:hypothetical protein